MEHFTSQKIGDVKRKLNVWLWTHGYSFQHDSTISFIIDKNFSIPIIFLSNECQTRHV